MIIEEAVKKLEEDKILDLKKIEYIWLGKLKSILFAKFNIEYDIQDLKKYMLFNENFFEISNNFFVSKTKVKELLKDVSKEKYKFFLENRYIIQIDDKRLSKLLSNTKPYIQLLRYGLDNSYIDSEWLKDLNIEETNFADIYEVIEDLEKRGIEVK